MKKYKLKAGQVYQENEDGSRVILNRDEVRRIFGDKLDNNPLYNATPEVDLRGPHISQGPLADIEKNLPRNTPNWIRDIFTNPTDILSTFGSFVPGKLGSILGAGIGATVGELGKNIEAGNPVISSDQVTEMIPNILSNTAAAVGGELLSRPVAKFAGKVFGPRTPGTRLFSAEGNALAPKLRNKLTALWAGHFKNITPEEEAALHEIVPGTNKTWEDYLQLTVGQRTGFGGAKFAEQVGPKKEYKQRILEQADKIDEFKAYLRGKFLQQGPTYTPVPNYIYGRGIQRDISQERTALKNAQNSIWNRINTILDDPANKTPLKVVIGFNEVEQPVMIQGVNGGLVPKIDPTTLKVVTTKQKIPVTVDRIYKGLMPTNNTQTYISGIKDNINNIFSEDNLLKMSEKLRDKYTLLYKQIKEFTNPTMVVDANGQVVPQLGKEWTMAKDIKTEIGNILHNKKPADWTNNERMLGGIEEALEKDMAQYAQDHGFNSLYETAKSLRTTQGNLYSPRVMNFLFDNRRQKAYADKIIPAAINHPEAALEFKAALTPNKINDLKGGMLETAFDKAMMGKPDNFNPEAFRKEITDRNKGYLALFEPAEIGALNNFARTVGRVANSEGNAGKTAFEIRRFSMLLNLGSGVTTSVIKGAVSPATIASASGSVILLSLGDFSKVLLHPGTAKLAGQLARMDPNSPQARLISKGILYTLRGARIMIGPDKDHLEEGFIDQNGIPRPDTSFDNSGTN